MQQYDLCEHDAAPFGRAAHDFLNDCAESEELIGLGVVEYQFLDVLICDAFDFSQCGLLDAQDGLRRFLR